MNLAEGLVLELKRNRELLDEYLKIPTGVFGATIIALDIKAGERAQSSNDVVEMLKCYNSLQGNK